MYRHEEERHGVGGCQQQCSQPSAVPRCLWPAVTHLASLFQLLQNNYTYPTGVLKQIN